MRKILVLSGFVTLICAIYSIFWYQAAETVLDRTEAFAQSNDIRYQSIRYTGFPGIITVTLGNIQHQKPNDPAQWQAPLMQLSVRFWDWQNWSLSLPHEILLRNPNSRDMRIALRDAKALVALNDEGDVSSIQVTMKQLLVKALPEDQTWLFMDDVYLALMEGEDNTGLSGQSQEHILRFSAFEISGFDALLPSPIQLPVDVTMGPLTLQARSFGEIPESLSPDSLRLWQEKGGKIDLDQLDLKVVDQDYALTGVLGLDDALRPRLASELRIPDLSVTSNQVAELGDIPEDFTKAFEMIVGLLAIQEQTGGKSHVLLPISIENGDLYLGPLRLWEIPPIDQWNRDMPAIALPASPSVELPSRPDTAPSNAPASDIPDIQVELSEPPTVNLDKWYSE